MAVKANVFASQAERDNFYKLSRVWSSNYRIYHNLPFLNVFDKNNLVDLSSWQSIGAFTLSDVEFNRLKKTSIDYTLCDLQDRPTVCIEFDGMQKGVNVGTEYYADHSNPDPWRQTIMELKLKVAYGSAFPYFIVSYDQFADLAQDIELTIVDGIIGNVLANRAKDVKFAEGFTPEELGISEEDFEALPEWEKHDIIQDWAIGVEVDSEMDHNPVAQKSADLKRELALTEPKVKSWSVQWHSYPEINGMQTPQDRLNGIMNALKSGATVTLKTPDFGDVSAIAWLPNFKARYFTDSSLVEDIAFILAAMRLKVLRTRKR